MLKSEEQKYIYFSVNNKLRQTRFAWQTHYFRILTSTRHSDVLRCEGNDPA